MSDKNILEQLRQAGGMRGRWSTPQTPNDSITGTLSLSKDGRMELTIEREVTPAEGFRSMFSPPGEPIPLLIGQLNEGAFCTLKGLVLSRKLPYSFSAQVLSQVYSAQYALFGAQIDDLAEFKIRSISLWLPVLMDWTKTACCSVSHQGLKLVIETEPLQTMSLGEAGTFTAEIRVAAGWSTNAIPSQIPSVVPESRIQVSFSEPPLLESATKLIPLMLSFFSLATLSAVRVSSFTCESDSAEPMMPTDNGERPSYHPIMVWYRGLSQDISYDGLSDANMFFTYSDLKESGILDALVKTLVRYDEFDHLLPLLVPESGDFYSYSRQRFLNAMQSLEYLDRMAGHSAVLASDEFEARKKEILEGVQSSIRSWLTEKLQYANEPNLRKRMKNIVLKNVELLQTTVDEQDRLVDNAVKTRNYLVHLDSEAREGAILDGRLIELTDKAEALARLSFLRAIGFSEERLRVLLSHNDRSYMRRMKAMFRSSGEVAKASELAEGNDAQDN